MNRKRAIGGLTGLALAIGVSIVGIRPSTAITLYGFGCTIIGAATNTSTIISNGNCTSLQASIRNATTGGWIFGPRVTASSGGNRTTILKSVATAKVPVTGVNKHRGDGWYMSAYFNAIW